MNGPVVSVVAKESNVGGPEGSVERSPAEFGPGGVKMLPCQISKGDGYVGRKGVRWGGFTQVQGGVEVPLEMAVDQEQFGGRKGLCIDHPWGKGSKS